MAISKNVTAMFFFLSFTAVSLVTFTLTLSQRVKNPAHPAAADQASSQSSILHKGKSMSTTPITNEINGCSTSDSSPRLLVATRIHKTSASHMADPKNVVAFVKSAMGYATAILLCIGIGDTLENVDYLDKLSTALKSEGLLTPSIIIMPITPWGKGFSLPLNAAIQKAINDQYDLIAFQSLEFRIQPGAVQSLIHRVCQENTLVVGPSLPGHDFSVGLQTLRGRTCPWNTFSIWTVRNLGLIGFPLVADGLGSNNGGVEEVSAINLLQSINPKLRAVLLRTKGVEWETDFTDEARAAWQEKKMKSKDERPEFQMKLLQNVPRGTVEHIVEE